MSFGVDMKRFSDKVSQRLRDIDERVGQIAYSSIVEGSALTGAPGQPVGGNQPGHRYIGGFLRGSWQIVRGNLRTAITTDTIYAPQIEDGTRAGRALTLWSAVGGWHSVALTRIAWPKIVEQATKEVVGNGA